MSQFQSPPHRIRLAGSDDLVALQQIEVAAGRCFSDLGMDEIAHDDPPPLGELDRHRREGTAWVAVNSEDTPVAYLIADYVDGALHVEQVSVHPDFSRRGIGRSLIEHAGGQAFVSGYTAITLTTFAEVIWNAPYYQRCGFRTLGEHELTPGLRAIREQEKIRGLDRWPRICMRKELP